MATETQPLTADMHNLYIHRKRPNWGRAILAWEQGEKRGYQFEDGRLRIFKKGFYDMFDVVDAPEDDDSTLVSTLRSRARLIIERRDQAAEGNASTIEAPYPFEDQLKIFINVYPNGFTDESWTKDRRGEGAGRRLKRHRDPAIAQARADLAEDKVRDHLAAGDAAAIINAIVDNLQNCDLVQRSKTKSIERLQGAEATELAEAFVGMLYSEEPMSTRFKRYVDAMPSNDWRVITAPLALVQPEEHVCVRPSVFRKQAASIAPRSIYTARPSIHSYRDMRRMAQATFKQLEEAGQEPRDLLDIYDFIWITLRPSAEKHLDD